MFGAILVFLFACAIVAVYMHIVRSFLRASELDDVDTTVPSPERTSEEAAVGEDSSRQAGPASREQWVH